ncbi:hypothetical protein Ae201684P_012775 [Aphanomyces euteiches]|nr:hypothetical protein Ae201684P_012775 [Aphanomyces euteiches]
MKITMFLLVVATAAVHHRCGQSCTSSTQCSKGLTCYSSKGDLTNDGTCRQVLNENAECNATKTTSLCAPICDRPRGDECILGFDGKHHCYRLERRLDN